MNVRCGWIFVLSTLIIGMSNNVAGASEPYLCNPQTAELEFRNEHSELSVKVKFYEAMSLCTLHYERLERIRPVQVKILFNGNEYEVNKKCVDRMKFDLHGITVEFSQKEPGFALWFMDSHKAAPDLLAREKESVGILLEKGKLHCLFWGEFQEF